MLNGENKREVLTQGLVMSASALVPFGYFQARFADPTLSSTAAFCALSSAQLLHALMPQGNEGSSRNWKEIPAVQEAPYLGQERSYVGLASAGGLALLAAGIYLPFLRRSLGTRVLNATQVMSLVPVIAGTLLVNRLLLRPMQ
jgi:hypothetical protein